MFLGTGCCFDWGYEGDIGPENWGDISPDYAIANTGKEQSPIDVDSFVLDKERGPIEFNYDPIPFVLENKGLIMQSECKGEASIKVNGKVYNLLQFHFHIPSEHTVQGKKYAMELHFVHQSAEGEFAVVGVFMKEGEANPVIQQLWDNIPPVGEHAKLPGASIKLKSLLPKNGSYYYWKGSLTIPPCTEGLQWMMLVDPITVSPEQVEQFRSVIGKNARPVQPKNHRIIKKVNTSEIKFSSH